MHELDRCLQLNYQKYRYIFGSALRWLPTQRAPLLLWYYISALRLLEYAMLSSIGHQSLP